jgi:hypothetical protein
VIAKNQKKAIAKVIEGNFREDIVLCDEVISAKNLAIKKIVSLHPTVFEYKPIAELVLRYNFYLKNCKKSPYKIENPKFFKEWCLTEI